MSNVADLATGEETWRRTVDTRKILRSWSSQPAVWGPMESLLVSMDIAVVTPESLPATHLGGDGCS